ncbi:TPA: hypothetical protein ACIE98_000106 [Citrobacter koseri]|uniref:hypothetical protein n=1 Tax=unclassified Citrobacter TaxID=2644389 RepID=UPI001A2F4778|nr:MULTISPECIES: hypothetical protein [unclassified Citrobacter]HAT3927617.1 hypothetical protein [Citrobacter koseri]MDM2947306.1 hypothetical protein [Citrobacter sp. CK207]MDM3009564.1 hypothetical protein [Citrobacter sp. CK191]HEM6827248.1 hypothetical protein [Citrobacter koseri]HEM6877566.1 hypothetical protein [Citrobacter koseri]
MKSTVETKIIELVKLGHELAKELHCAESAALVSDLATQLDVQFARSNALAAKLSMINGLMDAAEQANKLAQEATEKLVQERDALAAENAALKAVLRPSDIQSEWTDAFGDTAVIEHDATGDNQGHSVSWSWVGNQEEVIKSVLLAVDGSIKTPATEAFLAEVRAQGVDAAIEHLHKKFEGTGQIGVPVMTLEWLAQELRKGGAA